MGHWLAGFVVRKFLFLARSWCQPLITKYPIMGRLNSRNYSFHTLRDWKLKFSSHPYRAFLLSSVASSPYVGKDKDNFGVSSCKDTIPTVSIRAPLVESCLTLNYWSKCPFSKWGHVGSLGISIGMYWPHNSIQHLEISAVPVSSTLTAYWVQKKTPDPNCRSALYIRKSHGGIKCLGKGKTYDSSPSCLTTVQSKIVGMDLDI